MFVFFFRFLFYRDQTSIYHGILNVLEALTNAQPERKKQTNINTQTKNVNKHERKNKQT